MKEYEFTLTFALPTRNTDPQLYIDALMEAGCDDALIGVGVSGRIALDFTRQSDSAINAMTSAIENVLSAIPNATLIESNPDLVGVSDIAGILKVSRQAVQKMVNKHIMTFPTPVHSGSTQIWHLANVLAWSAAHTSHSHINDSLIEIAEASRKINLAREINDLQGIMPSQITKLFLPSKTKGAEPMAIPR
ncbi:DNA-binding protein [Marinomonas sp. M1K-6]|uniref:DNA-binding protein n=1 Tax=Marinomonas profundi TaxID=2726122 RepID=A0A847R0I1_9GAMM|nr:DNA-binding protein [Marinomonas profundi]NLQ16995.1 DNA-binding protein [Marinomonas profundi]UDV02720.1 DNA-binding protein [Marinomonas profundi]